MWARIQRGSIHARYDAYSNLTNHTGLCMKKPNQGEKRSLIYVDLQSLSAEFQAQWERTNKP